MSDGGRGRASLGMEVLKSSQDWDAKRSAVRSIAWLDGWCVTVVYSAEVLDDESATPLFLLERVKNPAALFGAETCDFDSAVRQLSCVRSSVFGQLSKVVVAVCARDVNRKANQIATCRVHHLTRTR
jgi:hypothetical protein